MKKTFPIDHAVPISKTVRAGDFIFTSAFGPWLFDPRNVTLMRRATSSTTARASDR